MPRAFEVVPNPKPRARPRVPAPRSPWGFVMHSKAETPAPAARPTSWPGKEGRSYDGTGGKGNEISAMSAGEKPAVIVGGRSLPPPPWSQRGDLRAGSREAKEQRFRKQALGIQLAPQVGGLLPSPPKASRLLVHVCILRSRAPGGCPPQATCPGTASGVQ